MSLRRDIQRLLSRFRPTSSDPASLAEMQAISSPAPEGLSLLRWIFLPLLLLGLFLWASASLRSQTQAASSPLLPVIFDAPLPSPSLRSALSRPASGRYFTIRPQGDPASLVLEDPGPGVRAYQGEEVVPLLGPQAPHMSLFLTACRPEPSPQEIRIYTGDGQILWLCQNPLQTDQIEIRRIGWRITASSLRRSPLLGRSADADLALSSAMLPLRSVSLKRQASEIIVESVEARQGLPASRRLLCLERRRSAASEIREPIIASDTTQATEGTEDPEETDATHTTNATPRGPDPKQAPVKTSPPDPATASAKKDEAQNKKDDPCQAESLRVKAGDVWRLFSRHHRHRAVSLLWQEAIQEKGAIDLFVVPSDGEGVSFRHVSVERLREEKKEGILVARGDIFFREILPDSVRTLDLDEAIHTMILRKTLLYLEPLSLRRSLQQRHRPEIPLALLPEISPEPSSFREIGPLTRDPFLRARLWMANQALAMGYRSQARSLFRLRYEDTKSDGEILGLGITGATLQAPLRNLLQPRQRSTLLHPRLTTHLTPQRYTRPFLEVFSEVPQAPSDGIFFVLEQPLEILFSTIPPPQAKARSFVEAPSVGQPRSLLFIKDRIYTTFQPFAWETFSPPPPTPPPPSTPPTPPPSSQPSLPTPTPGLPPPSRLPATEDRRHLRFVFTVKGRWWLRQPDLQRSSKDWPLADLARKLAKPDAAQELLRDIQQANPGRLQKRPHCGQESRKEGGKTRHRQGCWGDAEIVEEGKAVIIPCSPGLLSSITELRCREGEVQPKLDAQGRIQAAPVEALDGLHGIVLLPEAACKGKKDEKKTKESDLALDPALKSSLLQGLHPPPRHCLRLLAGSLEVLLNEKPISLEYPYLLRDGDRIKLGGRTLRYRRPEPILAFSRYRGDQIVSQYPDGPVFAHTIAGSVGGPYTSDPKALASLLPPPPAKPTDPLRPQLRKIATTLAPDLQHILWRVAARHFARLDSPEFQAKFRRRYIRNPKKPHAGAVLLLHRRTGQILSALSFPTFDPNLSEEASEAPLRRRYRYLRGQIVDRYGMTDSLLAYDPLRLPPDPPPRKPLEGKPNHIPHLVEALAWDKEEASQGIRGDDRSGWLVERAFGGAQTPGSTAKILTAIAYTRFLRAQGRPVAFPAHQCSGGMMFEIQSRKTQGWRPSPIHFRCHKREGHGTIDLKTAMAVSCNVYFAKLSLEMAGIASDLLRPGRSPVRSYSHKDSGSGRYEFFRLPARSLVQPLSEDPSRRMLFRTAHLFGFSMRYTYLLDRLRHSQYTDLFWETGLPRWPGLPESLRGKERQKALREQIQRRSRQDQPFGWFGIGRFFGDAAAFPAWQQWVPSTTEPRFGRPSSPRHTFGSLAASLRGMAYVGFGQNLTVTPLQISQVIAAVANGGWIAPPRFWLGDWPDPQTLPTAATPEALPRPAPRRILDASDARLIQESLAAVTTQGTAAKPFAAFQRTCLAPLGLQIIGKTGTAETSSPLLRKQRLEAVRAAGARYFRGNDRQAFLKDSGCQQRKFWQYDYPEESVADSLFVGALLPLSGSVASASPPSLQGFPLSELAFAVVVKNGYHPEGTPCRQKGQDTDRSEARYLAHDLLLALFQYGGFCSDLMDASAPRSPLAFPSPPKPRRSGRIKRSKKRTSSRRPRSKKSQRLRPRRTP